MQFSSRTETSWACCVLLLTNTIHPHVSLSDDESDLVMETANFLQELCLRAEEKVAAAGGCPAELLACPSTSAEGPGLRQEN